MPPWPSGFLAVSIRPSVLHNASTQFADGGEFGFGAESALRRAACYARGPVALEGLTIFKTIVRGSGQVRP